MATPNDVNLVTPDPTNDYCLASGISGDQQKWNPTVILVGAGVTSIGSGAIITTAERTAISTNTSHATGSGSDHAAVAANTVKLGTITSVGSGAIITALERTSLTNSTAHIAGSGLDHSMVATNTTKLATITSVGSGDIITTAERAQVPSSPSAGQVGYAWAATGAGTANWTAISTGGDANHRGFYQDLATLQAASPLDPAESDGDFAILVNAGSDATVAAWDSDAGPAAWVEVGGAAVDSINFNGGLGVQVGAISIDGDDIGEGATNLWLTVAERAAVAASTTHETSTGADHTYIDQDVTSGSSPVFAVTNMTGSAAGLDSDATTHAASDGSSHTFLDQDVTSGSAPVLAVTNFTGTLAGIDSDATAHAASDGASHDFINQSVIAGSTPTFAGTNFTGIPALAITETLSAPLVWEFDDDVSDDDPTTGKFSGDNAAITAWNQINISPTSDDNLVVSSILAALRTGDFITIRQRGLASTKSAIFSVTATPTNEGTYYTIPVTWVYSSGKPADASKCQIDFQSMSSTGQFVWDSIAQLKAVTVGITNGDMFSVKGDPDLFQYDSAIVVFDEVQTYEATGLGAGAYVRQAWDSATVTPEQFGAVADDTTDDHDAIEAALLYASENNKEVLFSGKYYTASQIQMPTGVPSVDMTIQGIGAAQIRTDADIIVLDLWGGAAIPPTEGDLKIDGLTIVGDNSGVGQRGIQLSRIKRVSVTNCTFLTLGGASNVEPMLYAENCEDVIFTGNQIYGCDGSNSAGISMGLSTHGVISGNIIDGGGLLSECINVGSTVGTDRLYITVSNNVCLSPSRHCILMGYDEIDGRSACTGNVCHNGPWTAIYMQSGQGTHGRMTVTGNAISNCGGGHTFGGAIYYNNRGNDSGAVIANNFIYKTGYDEDDVAHSANAAVSVILISSVNSLVSNNVMVGSKTSHIRLETYTGTDSINNTISGNMMVDAEVQCIDLDAISSGDIIGDTHIIGNRISNLDEDADGIRFSTSGGGVLGSVMIQSNVFTGANASTSKNAINFRYTPPNGVIENNRFENWDYAIRHTFTFTGYTDKMIGDDLIVRNNHCHDIGTEAYTLGSANTPAIIQGATFTGTITSDGWDGLCYHGRSLGGNRWELLELTAAPGASTGAWSRGSSFHTITPSARTSPGQMCVTSGGYQTGTHDMAGTHTGGNNEAILTDSSENWETDELVGLTVNNDTKGESGTITANTATTITATLSGGEDWDTSDAYSIDGSAILVDPSLVLMTDSLVGGTITNVTDGSSGTITANTATTITATLSGGTDNDWDDGDTFTLSAPVWKDFAALGA